MSSVKKYGAVAFLVAREKVGTGHCEKKTMFYTGFISKMKSLAYFGLASWKGLRARFVRDVLLVALKPKRGSTYYPETSFFAL